MRPTPRPSILLTPQHVANRAGCPANTVLKAIRDGQLAATKTRSGYAITPEAAAQWTAHKTFDARGQRSCATGMGISSAHQQGVICDED